MPYYTADKSRIFKQKTIWLYTFYDTYISIMKGNVIFTQKNGISIFYLFFHRNIERSTRLRASRRTGSALREELSNIDQPREKTIIDSNHHNKYFGMSARLQMPPRHGAALFFGDFLLVIKESRKPGEAGIADTAVRPPRRRVLFAPASKCKDALVPPKTRMSRGGFGRAKSGKIALPLFSGFSIPQKAGNKNPA
jgi:hypothetical protein